MPLVYDYSGIDVDEMLDALAYGALVMFGMLAVMEVLYEEPTSNPGCAHPLDDGRHLSERQIRTLEQGHEIRIERFDVPDLHLEATVGDEDDE